MATVEAGTQGALAAILAEAGDGWAGGLVLAEPGAQPTDEDSAKWAGDLGAEALLFVGVVQSSRSARVAIRFRAPQSARDWSRKYGGALLNAPAWAVATALDLVRRELSGEGEG